MTDEIQSTAVLIKIPETTMKFKPFDDRILVKLEPKADKTPGGIVLPGRDDREPYRAKVLAVGRSVGWRSAVEAAALDKPREIPTPIAVNDTILCHPYDATEIKVEDETFHVVREKDVLGVFA